MTDRNKKNDSPALPRVLLELRPALEGYAGIPQETRLLFRGLCMLDEYQVEGLIQHSSRSLARGLTRRNAKMFRGAGGEARKVNRYSRVVVSLAERPYLTLFDKIADFSQRKLESVDMTFTAFHGLKDIQLSAFESRHFKDFVWRTFFSKTLPAADFELVTSANHQVCSVPWQVMHRAGLNTLNLLTQPRYPALDTEGIDVVITQTPYPARLHKRTRMVVRYHDAVPVLMPHTISAKSFHQASHFYALLDNVRAGAWFACVSEATRQDLLKLFPAAEPRAVTIHNMVSHHYFEEESPFERVRQIVRTRLSDEFYVQTVDRNKTNNPVVARETAEKIRLRPRFDSLREQEAFYRRAMPEQPFRYLLMVSTLEPRKNHTRLVAAWETLKARVDPDLKLVLVGSLGWDYAQMLRSFGPWIDRGDLFCLNGVPAADLRVLYRHATATVCPSLAEGFDFSGVEAMACGGVVVSSSLPVHHEVFDDASVYFDPYSTGDLVRALTQAIYHADAPAARERLRARGREVAARYQPDRILPQWRDFLSRVRSEGGN